MLRATGRVALRVLGLGAVLVGALSGAAGVAVAAGSLPDERAYEMVSPPAKNGGDVMGAASRTRAAAAASAAGPMAVQFSSLAAFGDVRGTGIAADYIAQRDEIAGTNGWSTHAITPPQTPVGFALTYFTGAGTDPAYEGDLSPDLTHGVFRAWSLLGDSPNVKDVENFYARSDLRTPGAGSYQLLSNAAAPLAPGTQPPVYAGSSTDFSHTIFESREPRTPEAAGPMNVFESVNGAVRLAGILPDGTPANGSIAGQGASAHYPNHSISADGSRIFFSSPITSGGDLTDTSSSGADASKLYLRDDHGTADVADDTTVQVNASERTIPQTAGRAVFWAASADGSRAFFTSGELLTNDAVTQSLYMYDVHPDAQGHHLKLLDVDNEPADPPIAAIGVLGASDDGHYVYFVEAGQLVAGGPSLQGNLGIYLWHDESGTATIDYVGQLSTAQDKALNINSASWAYGNHDSRVTPDGKHLIFASTSGQGLTGYDQSSSCQARLDLDGQPGCTEIYVYSADTHQLACASCNPNAPATGDAINDARIGASATATTWHLSRAVSDNGQRVFFSSSDPLVPQDVNGKVDAYEYDVSTGTVHLLSSGKDPSDSFFLDASASGDDVFLLTRQRLVGWDTDGSYDLYDARVHGGFPEPVPARAACTGDACRGPQTAAPAALVPPSVALQTAGANHRLIRPHRARPKPKRCKRGYVRKRVHHRVKCLKKAPAKTKHARAKRSGT